jgi:hemerythrin
MEKLPRLTWEPSYSYHVEVIDAQHRKLFDIVNHLMDLFEATCDGNTSELLPVLHELVEYVSVHFHQEEMIMSDADYPDLQSHYWEHRKFSNDVLGFLNDFREGNADLGINMLVFLLGWVRTHVTTSDVRCGEYLFKNPEKLKLFPVVIN